MGEFFFPGSYNVFLNPLLFSPSLFSLFSLSSLAQSFCQQDEKKLKLFDDGRAKGSVLIQGLEEVAVQSKDEVYDIMAKVRMCKER